VNGINGPSKEQIREWLIHRQIHRAPLPDREQIQRELGWTLMEKDARSTSIAHVRNGNWQGASWCAVSL